MANRCIVAVLLLLQLIAFANAQNATSAPAVTSAPTTVITGNVRPSGVVFDIRTYTSSSWLTDPEAVFVQMLSLFQTLPTWWNAGGAPVQYAVVLPTFLNNEYLYSYTINGITNTYYAFLTNTLYAVNNSRLILLNEKTTVSGLINNGLSECQYAASLGISCTFMVDVNNDTDSTSSFVGTSLVYVQQTLAATAQKMTSVTFNDVLLYDITGLQVLPEKQPAYTEPSSTKASVEVVISDPYFLYLSSSSINAVFDTTSTMARCCGFVVDKITIDATVYVQSAPSLLQSFINLAASNGISVDLYLSDPTWGFDTSHADLQAALTLVLQFIYNGTVTYPPSATLPSPPPGFIPTPSPVPSALPSSSPSASASPSSSPSSSSSPSASASPSMSSGSGSTSAPSSSPSMSSGSGSASPPPSSAPSLSSGSGLTSAPSSAPSVSSGSTSAPSNSSSNSTAAPTPIFNGDTSSSAAPTSASTSTTGGSPSQAAQTSSAVGSGELATIALKLIAIMVLSLSAVAIV